MWIVRQPVSDRLSQKFMHCSHWALPVKTLSRLSGDHEQDSVKTSMQAAAEPNVTDRKTATSSDRITKFWNKSFFQSGWLLLTNILKFRKKNIDLNIAASQRGYGKTKSLNISKIVSIFAGNWQPLTYISYVRQVERAYKLLENHIRVCRNFR